VRLFILYYIKNIFPTFFSNIVRFSYTKSNSFKHTLLEMNRNRMVLVRYKRVSWSVSNFVIQCNYSRFYSFMVITCL